MVCAGADFYPCWRNCAPLAENGGCEERSQAAIMCSVLARRFRFGGGKNQQPAAKIALEITLRKAPRRGRREVGKVEVGRCSGVGASRPSWRCWGENSGLGIGISLKMSPLALKTSPSPPSLSLPQTMREQLEKGSEKKFLTNASVE